MMAGEKTSPATNAFDDLRSKRRLTGTVFMLLPPKASLSCTAIDRCGRSAYYSQIYDQTEVPCKGSKIVEIGELECAFPARQSSGIVGSN
jgi:hypothetical protein